MLTAVILLLFTFVRGVQPTETWYFAQRAFDLIAYTASGTQHDVLPNAGEAQAAWRVDDETGLFLFENGDKHHLYIVTPDKATEVAVPDDLDAGNYRREITYSGSYILLWDTSNGVLPAPALLVNVTTAKAVPLTGAISMEARFNGDTLRYMSLDDTDHWSLVERTLASGEEETLNTLPDADRFLFFSADTLGERWLYLTRRENRIVNPLVSADGSTGEIGGGTDEQSLYWSFFGDTLVGSSPLCESDCPIIVRTGDAETSFIVPFDGIGITALAQPTLESLVIIHQGEDFWLLRENEEPLNLGKFDAQKIFSGVEGAISPDQRYLLAQSPSNPADFNVWNLVKAEAVVSLSTDIGVQVNYFSDGFTATTFDTPGETFLYRYADKSQVSLPHGKSGVYFALLADGTLLYSLPKDNEAIGDWGIYIYNPAQDQFTQLLFQAKLVYLQPLR